MRIKVIFKQFILMFIFIGKKNNLIGKYFGKEPLQKFPDPNWLSNMVNFLFASRYFLLLICFHIKNYMSVYFKHKMHGIFLYDR